MRILQSGTTYTTTYVCQPSTVDDMVFLSPGQRVVASAWTKTSGVSVNRDATSEGLYGAFVKVLFYDISGTYLGYRRSSTVTKSETSWTPLTVDSLAPAGARYARLTLQAANYYGTVYFDDASIATGRAVLTDADGTGHTLQPTDEGGFTRDPYAGGLKLERTDAAAGAKVTPWEGTGAEFTPNESFEYVPSSTSWYESNTSVTDQVSGVAHTGTHSMRFNSSAYTWVHASTDAPGGPYGAVVTPGKEIRASAWVNTDALQRNTSTPSGVALRIYYYNSSGGSYGYSQSTWQQSYDSNGWRRMTLSATVPSGATRAKLNIEYANSKGIVYVDDVSMSQYAMAEGDSVDGSFVGDAADFDTCWVASDGSRYLQYELGKTVRSAALDMYLFDAEEGVQIASSGYGTAPQYGYRVRLAKKATDFDGTSQDTTIAAYVASGASGWQRIRMPSDFEFRYVRVEALYASHGSELRIAELDVPVYEIGDTQAAFGSSGRLEALADASGNWTDYSYGGSGALERITDAAGRKLELGRDGGLPDSWSYTAKDSSGVETVSVPVRYTRDGTSTFTVEVDERIAASYGYSDGRITRIADADGVATSISYDAQGRVASVTRGQETSAVVTTYAYATVSGPTDKATITTTGGTDTLSREVQFDTSKGCQVTKITSMDPTGPDPSTTITYDEYHHASSITDPGSHKTYLTRDGHGNVLDSTEASGTSLERFSRADYANDRVTKSVDVKGNVSSFKYDEAWRLLVSSVAVTDDEGDGEASARQTYDSWGNRITGEIQNSSVHSILENGNMEDDPFIPGGGWGVNSGSVSWSDMGAQDELGKGIVVAPSGGTVGEARTYAAGFIHASDTYSVSAWMRGTGELAVKCYSDDAGSQAIGSSLDVIEVADSAAATTLTRRSGTFIAPAGTRTVRLFARSYTGALYLDNVALERSNVAGTANFIANGSVELNDSASDPAPLDWSHSIDGPTYAYAYGEAVEGARSLAITASGTDDGRWWSDAVPMDADTTLTASVWVKTTSVGSSGGVKVYTRFLNSSGAIITSAETSITPDDKCVSGTTEWTRYV